MSGSIRFDRQAVSIPSTSTAPVGSLPPGASSSGQAFRSLLAGSPAPAPATPAVSFADPRGQIHAASLAPLACQLPVPPGSGWTGRVLAATDVSMAGWFAQDGDGAPQMSASSAPAGAVLSVVPASPGGANGRRSAFA